MPPAPPPVPSRTVSAAPSPAPTIATSSTPSAASPMVVQAPTENDGEANTITYNIYDIIDITSVNP